MTNILEQVAKSHHSEFQPSSPDDYFALTLARRLDDPAAAEHYRILASRHPQSALLHAYRKASETNPGRKARVFHQILESLHRPAERRLPQPLLLSIRVERRSIAVVLFTGSHLEGWRVRQLPSDAQKAEEGCVGFLRAVLDEHQCDDIALEMAPDGTNAEKLHDAVMVECRERGLAVTEVPKQTVIETFAHPSPKTRAEIREIVGRMWAVPNLKNGRDYVLDAAAAGLYVQTRRLFDAKTG